MKTMDKNLVVGALGELASRTEQERLWCSDGSDGGRSPTYIKKLIAISIISP